jgi:hypothetical protein
MDTSSSNFDSKLVSNKLSISNAEHLSVFEARWSAQAALILPSGLSLLDVTAEMCVRTAEYVLVSQGGKPAYVLSTTIRAALKKRGFTAGKQQLPKLPKPSVSPRPEKRVVSPPVSFESDVEDETHPGQETKTPSTQSSQAPPSTPATKLRKPSLSAASF